MPGKNARITARNRAAGKGATESSATSSGSMNSSQWDLAVTRVFEAPRDLVWKMWTEAEQLAQWWGPKGFTNPVCEVDVRPGGGIRIHMRGPDGVVYPMKGEFREIVKPERLVFVTSALDEKGDSMFDVLNTVVFTEQRGKTSMTLQACVIRAGAEAPQYLKGMEMGWSQSLDRLGAHLAASVAKGGMAMLAGDREIVATRVFDAPRELLWRIFVDPRHVVEWFGPMGFTTTIQEMDVKAGGVWQHVMHGPDGRDYHNRIVYHEVSKPERLVYEHCPEKGSEPVSFLTTVTFTPEGKKTRIEFRMLFPSAAERDRNEKTYGAVEGLTQTLGRLAGYVEKMASDARSA